MVNLKVEKFKAKGSKGEELNRLRAGRLADTERLMILQEIGDYARKKYDSYVLGNTYGYNLKMLKGALKYIPDIESFENYYYVDTGSDRKNKIADYFENGTGLYNVKYSTSARKKIKAKLPNKVMKFRKVWKGKRFAASVKGVRPIYMMRRTLKSIEFNRAQLQRNIRLRLGI